MNKNKNGKNNKKLLISAMILVAIVIILAGIAVYFVANKSGKDDKTLAYTRRKKINCSKYRSFYRIDSRKSSRRK